MRWSGEFAFGEVWVAFRGASAENRMHAHAALQVVASSDQLTLVDADASQYCGRAWVVRSGVRHCLLPASALTLVLIEPQSRLATGLLQRFPEAPIAQLPDDLAELLVSSIPVEEVVQTLERGVLERSTPIDSRLLQALAFLDREATKDAVAAASAHCGLSPSRLRALAQQQFCVPLSKLLLWKKIRRAFLAMGRGSGLADAAYEAGFADQAHLTRTMADVIGLTPHTAQTAVD
jgi:AraC-like DNA-binding protein